MTVAITAASAPIANDTWSTIINPHLDCPRRSLGTLSVKDFIMEWGGGILRRNSHLVRQLVARRERAITIVTKMAVSIGFGDRDGPAGVKIY